MRTMSDLKDRLRADLTAAIKSRDETRSSTLRMVLTAITNAEVAGKEHRELSDDDIIGVLSTESKKRREAATAFDDGGRSELAEKERAEAAVIADYLPQQLSEEEIAEIATSFAASPVGKVELDEGRFVVGSEVALVGVRVPVSVEWELDVRDGGLRFEPVRAKTLGEPVPEELLAGASFEYPIGGLPFEGELSSVEIWEDRLVLVGKAEDLPVG